MQEIGGQHFQAFLEGMPTLVFITGRDGQNIFVNRRFSEYTGLSTEALIGGSWIDAVHPDDRARVWEAWLEAFPRGGHFEIEYRLRNAAGQYRWHLARADALEWEGEPAAFWAGKVTDIDDQKRAELASAEREHQLALAQDAAGVGVFDWDLVTDTLHWTDGCRRVFGLAPGEPVSFDRFVNEMLFPEDREHTLALNLKVLDPADPQDQYSTEYRCVWPDGSVHWIDARGRVYFDGTSPGRRAVRFTGTVLDVTQRKAVEAQLADALAARDMLLSEVNHRVKNSLQIVAALLTLHAHRLPDGTARAALEEAQANLGVVAQIHERLYQTQQHGSLELGPFLYDLLSDVLRSSSGQHPAVRLDYAADADVSLDVSRAISLSIILNELATNALKYAWPGGAPGVLSLTVRRDGKHLCVTLSDNGGGLPEGFDPAGQNGLGLRIVQTLVRQLRGTLEAGGAPDGARFRLLLPLEP